MSDQSNHTTDANPLLGQLLDFSEILEDVINAMTEIAAPETDNARFQELNAEIIARCEQLAARCANGKYYHLATHKNRDSRRLAIIKMEIEVDSF